MFRLNWRPTRPWLLVAALFVVYAGILVWSNHRSEEELRESAYRAIRLQTEKGAARLAYFFSGRRNEISDLANSREVATYFINSDLGMSYEYGLRASVSAVNELLAHRQRVTSLGGRPIYLAIVMLDANGVAIASSGDLSLINAAVDHQPSFPEEDVSFVLDVTAGQIITSAPARLKGSLRGRVIASTPIDVLRQNFIEPANDQRLPVLVMKGYPITAGPLSSKALEDAARFAAADTRAAGGGASASAPPGTDLSAISAGIEGTPFSLVSVVANTQLLGRRTAHLLVLLAGTVPIAAIAISFVLWRLRRRNAQLARRYAESSRQVDVLEAHSSELREEVRKRQEAESALKEQTRQLERRTQDLQQAMDEARHLANYDMLTNLSNRAMFREYLRVALARARRDNTLLAVLFLDLDRFKRINDTFGHTAGDQVLRTVARRLEICVRSSDAIARESAPSMERSCVARQGGDEFTILLSGIHEPVVAGVVALRIIEALAAPIEVDANELLVTASIGISIFPNDGENEETLLKHADVAMYDAKDRGRNQYQFYEASMQEETIRRLELESDLLRGLGERQFTMVYQPIVDARSGKVVCFEALMRWEHPQRGRVLPSEFVPLAEECGLIVPLTEFALREVCQQLAAWQAEGILAKRVAVNISAKVIEFADLAELIETARRDAGIPYGLVELELTESILMTERELASALLGRLRDLGVRISIDDFGTGYSSLAYLKSLPIDLLKIDRSFVNDLEHDASSAVIIRTIIAMGRSLGLKVIAEGVETEMQRSFLVGAGCDMLQGFLIGRPSAPADIIFHDKACAALPA